MGYFEKSQKKRSEIELQIKKALKGFNFENPELPLIGKGLNNRIYRVSLERESVALRIAMEEHAEEYRKMEIWEKNIESYCQEMEKCDGSVAFCIGIQFPDGSMGIVTEDVTENGLYELTALFSLVRLEGDGPRDGDSVRVDGGIDNAIKLKDARIEQKYMKRENCIILDE